MIVSRYVNAIKKALLPLNIITTLNDRYDIYVLTERAVDM